MAAGETLFPESAPVALWVILSGEVALSDAAEGGQVLARGGDIIGSLCMLSGRPLNYSAAVIESGVALRIAREDLFDLLDGAPDLLRQLFEGMFRMGSDAERAPARCLTAAPHRARARLARRWSTSGGPRRRCGAPRCRSDRCSSSGWPLRGISRTASRCTAKPAAGNRFADGVADAAGGVVILDGDDAAAGRLRRGAAASPRRSAAPSRRR